MLDTRKRKRTLGDMIIEVVICFAKGLLWLVQFIHRTHIEFIPFCAIFVVYLIYGISLYSIGLILSFACLGLGLRCISVLYTLCIRMVAYPYPRLHGRADDTFLQEIEEVKQKYRGSYAVFWKDVEVQIKSDAYWQKSRLELLHDTFNPLMSKLLKSVEISMCLPIGLWIGHLADGLAPNVRCQVFLNFTAFFGENTLMSLGICGLLNLIALITWCNFASENIIKMKNKYNTSADNV